MSLASYLLQGKDVNDVAVIGKGHEYIRDEYMQRNVECADGGVFLTVQIYGIAGSTSSPEDYENLGVFYVPEGVDYRGKDIVIYKRGTSGLKLKTEKRKGPQHVNGFVWQKKKVYGDAAIWTIQPNNVILLEDSLYSDYTPAQPWNKSCNSEFVNFTHELAYDPDFSSNTSTVSVPDRVKSSLALPSMLLQDKISVPSVYESDVPQERRDTYPKVYDKLMTLVETYGDRRLEVKHNLLSQIEGIVSASEVDLDDLITKVNNFMSGSWSNRPHRRGVTGRGFFEKIRDGLVYILSRNDEEEGESDEDAEKVSSAELFKQVLAQVDELERLIPNSSQAFLDFINSNNIKEKVYILLVSTLLSLSYEKLLGIVNQLSSNYDLSLASAVKVLIEDPYLVGVFFSSLSYSNALKINTEFSTLSSPEITKQKEIYRVLSAFLNNEQQVILDKKSILKETFTSRDQENIADHNSVYYFNAHNTMLNLGITPQLNSDTCINASQLEEILNDLQNSGLILRSSKGYVLLFYVEREIYIYEKLRRMAELETGISDEIINAGVAEFESEMGFTLEAKQREGVDLVKYQVGILSGCAGSGKTTVSACMVNILKNLNRDFVFCAPTGKAARRLKETNKEFTVKTLHSQFKLGIGKSTDLFATLGSDGLGSYGTVIDGQDMSDPDFSSSSSPIYIFDEMGMCNLDIFYEVIKRLPLDSIVYFLGDIKQLLPIGLGAPFKEGMRMLPTVELLVSKRSAEGSLVNKNCSIINQGTGEELAYGPDFQFVQVGDRLINKKVSELVKQLVSSGYAPEEVQVVTPYQKKEILYSTTNINPVLQKFFAEQNSRKLAFAKKNSQEFYVDDRVIHTTSNNYNFRRYLQSGNSFQEVQTHGVVNGDVGRIVGVVDSSLVNISTLPASERTEEDKKLKLRSDESWVGDKKKFVIVEYYDVELSQNTVVLYHATENKDGLLNGKDLDCLQLAYALTVHKMQGSQARVVVFPIGAPFKYKASDSNSKGEFLTRNLVYTALSRATEKVIIVGSKEGFDSYRQQEDTSNRDSILTILNN